jgi:hypothetical protein
LASKPRVYRQNCVVGTKMLIISKNKILLRFTSQTNVTNPETSNVTNI